MKATYQNVEKSIGFFFDVSMNKDREDLRAASKKEESNKRARDDDLEAAFGEFLKKVKREEGAETEVKTATATATELGRAGATRVGAQHIATKGEKDAATKGEKHAATKGEKHDATKAEPGGKDSKQARNEEKEHGGSSKSSMDACVRSYSLLRSAAKSFAESFGRVVEEQESGRGEAPRAKRSKYEERIRDWASSTEDKKAILHILSMIQHE